MRSCWRTKTSLRGFSLVELVMAMALMGFLSLMLLNLQGYLSVVANRAKIRAGVGGERTVGERMLRNHIVDAGPSFNNVAGTSVLDDNGKNFFVLNSEYPIQYRPAADRFREIVLTPTGRTSAVMLIVSNLHGTDGAVDHVKQVLIDPLKFYTWGAETLTTSALLTYQGPTNNSYIQTIAPRMWKQGQHLYFYAVGAFRSPTAALSDFHKPYSFFGTVNTTAGTINAQTFGGLVDNIHPVDGTTPLTDLDTFLRLLPANGGATPYVYMQPVDLMKYEIKPEIGSPSKYRLVSSEYHGGSFTNEITMATHVDKVILRRDSIAETLITFAIEVSE